MVRDLDAALQYWTEALGVGPFFVLPKLSPEEFRYLGQPSPPPLISIAFANSGDMQVELIQQHDDHPSAYRDFLEAGREGIQHVGAWLNPKDYDATLAGQLAAGVSVVHEGRIPGRGVRFAYFATEAPAGVMYEISDLIQPHTYPLHQMIAVAAQEWDGSDPVRELRSLAATLPTDES